MYRIAVLDPNPSQFSTAGTAVPIAHALYSAVEEESKRPPQGMETFQL